MHRPLLARVPLRFPAEGSLWSHLEQAPPREQVTGAMSSDKDTTPRADPATKQLPRQTDRERGNRCTPHNTGSAGVPGAEPQQRLADLPQW